MAEVQSDIAPDPCQTALGFACGPNASCLTEDDTPRCVCAPGFEGDGASCIRNLCLSVDGEEVCGANASCFVAGSDATLAECTCAKGFADCDGDVTLGCEASLLTDAKHCGGCGLACAPGIACVEGACQPKYKHIAFSTSSLSSCIITHSDELYCEGPIAFPYTLDSHKRVEIRALSSPSLLAAGNSSACAIDTSTSELVCWGANVAGEVGVLNDNDAGVSIGLYRQPDPGITALASGLGYACAVVEGQVYCWGRDLVLSDGYDYEPVHRRGSDFTRPVLSRGQPLSGIVQLSASFSNICALSAVGEVLCWGINLPQPVPVHTTKDGDELTPLPDAKAICSTAVGLCVLRDGGTVACTSAPPSAHEPYTADAVFLDHIEEVACGTQHVCARTQDGLVYCWGDNSLGALGIGSSEANRDEPTPVPELSQVTQVYAGAFRTCAVVRDGRTFCWGVENYQADVPTTRLSPVEITDWL